ncbi:MAG: hypothetical protein LV473_21050 [Nitrospira sp.]|nr:hypothetical protein [Nitrospira sp.]
MPSSSQRNTRNTGKVHTKQSDTRTSIIADAAEQSPELEFWYCPCPGIIPREEPVETPREQFERAESLRILRFMADTGNADIQPLFELGATIRSDNGRLRLWFEISEDTRWDKVGKNLKYLREWKRRLVRFDGKRDAQQSHIETIIEDLRTAAKDPNQSVAEQINAWIADQLRTWHHSKGIARTRIDGELFAVLRSFNFEEAKIEAMLNDASQRIDRGGKNPFPERDERGVLVKRGQYPVSGELLKNLSRKWKKRAASPRLPSRPSKNTR